MKTQKEQVKVKKTQTALQNRLSELGEDVSVSRPAAAQEEGGGGASLGSLGQLMQSGIGGMGGLSINPMQGASDGAAGIGMGIASMGSMVSALTSGFGAGLLGGGLSGGGLFGGGLSGQGQGGFSPLTGFGGGLQGAGAQPSAAGGAQPAPGAAPANSPVSGILGQKGSPMAAQGAPGQQKGGKLKAAQMAAAAATPKV